MNSILSLRKQFGNFLSVSSSDPDDSRRRKLVAILLFGLSIIALIITLVGLGFIFFADAHWDDVSLPIFIGFGFAILSSGIFVLNHYRFGSLSAWILLLLLLTAISNADSPEQLVDGRSVFLFMIPILMASFIIFPQASFIFAVFSSFVVLLILTPQSVLPTPNYFVTVAFFAIAFVSWLASRSMENALKDLRALNLELDQRVEDRTRELAQALTRESAEASKNQAILEDIADGVIVFDANETMIVANPAVCRLLDISRTDLLDKKVHDFIDRGPLSEEDAKKLHELFIQPDKEAPSVRSAWGEKTLTITTAPVKTLNDEPVGTVAVFRDFTHEAEIEKMKNTFVAMVSHELRTPLNAVLAYSEMIKDEVYGPVNSQQANAAERIFKNTQRLVGLVNDLLDQARLEAGKMSIEIAPFQISDIVDSVHGILEKPAADKGLNLLIEVENTAPKTVWGDSHRYQQIFINLLNNAIKFTESGQVLLKIAGSNDDFWSMEVTDTGPGISENELPYIFDTFRQVGSLITRQHAGAGLGLSIVKRLVELMGGTIQVRSTVGVGTTFTLKMPVKTKKP